MDYRDDHLVEPLVVTRCAGAGPYMLVDGHLRHAALVDLGNRAAPCLIASQVRSGLTPGGRWISNHRVPGDKP